MWEDFTNKDDTRLGLEQLQRALELQVALDRAVCSAYVKQWLPQLADTWRDGSRLGGANARARIQELFWERIKRQLRHWREAVPAMLAKARSLRSKAAQDKEQSMTLENVKAYVSALVQNLQAAVVHDGRPVFDTEVAGRTWAQEVALTTTLFGPPAKLWLDYLSPTELEQTLVAYGGLDQDVTQDVKDMNARLTGSVQFDRLVEVVTTMVFNIRFQRGKFDAMRSMASPSRGPTNLPRFADAVHGVLKQRVITILIGGVGHLDEVQRQCLAAPRPFDELDEVGGYCGPEPQQSSQCAHYACAHTCGLAHVADVPERQPGSAHRLGRRRWRSGLPIRARPSHLRHAAQVGGAEQPIAQQGRARAPIAGAGAQPARADSQAQPPPVSPPYRGRGAQRPAACGAKDGCH